jgi:HAD superfamily hydrolase (TIGR01459 family)
MAHPSPTLISGLSGIAGRYDAAICDVWGVLHNGRDVFAPALDAMRQFRVSQGPVVLLSNAPRPAEGVIAMFRRLSMPLDFYDAIVTSGGAARAGLSGLAEGGRTLKLFYLGPSRDNPLFEGLNVRLTEEESAEAILCTGFYDDESETPEDYRVMLERSAARGLPFFCANPDIVVQRGDKLVYCAGAIGKLYESLGGRVTYYGKPHAAVFETALAEARRHGAARSPLVIGDGLETDILGANRMGLDCLFIASGIHGAELERGESGLTALFREKGVSATAAMTSLSW